MKKRVVLLALTLVLVLGTSAAFGWTQFFSYNRDIDPNSSVTTQTFKSTGDWTLNHSQSAANVDESITVHVAVYKGASLVYNKDIAGNRISKKIVIANGAGTYKITFRNLTKYTVKVSGSALK